MTLEQILGGPTSIRDNANAWLLRTSNASYINKDQQPVLYSILKKIADKKGITVEEYQNL